MTKTFVSLIFLLASLCPLAIGAEFDRAFELSQNGVGPIRVNMKIVIDGKHAEIAATGRNDSKQFIERAEFCMSPPEDHSRCFYRFWKYSWTAGEVVTWDVHGPAYGGLQSSEAHLKGPLEPVVTDPNKPPPQASPFATILRIYVADFKGNTGDQARDQIEAVLANTGRFIPVEDEAKADAVIKGRSDTRESATKTTDSHLGVGSGVGGASGRVAAVTGVSAGKGSSRTEVILSDTLIVRVVAKSGEVIWAWDDTNPCGTTGHAKCAIDDLMAASRR
jgi:hypothetical protein